MESIPPRWQGPPTIQWPDGERSGQTRGMTTGWDSLVEQLPATAARALRDLLDRDDPEVVGMVLSGSAGRGLATSRSDVDVYVVTDGRPGSRSEVRRRPGIDEARLTLAELERPA